MWPYIIPVPLWELRYRDYDINGDPPYWGSGGAAFVYEKDGSGFWNQTQKLLTNDRFTSDKFGHTVDLDNDTIIGGAPEDNSTAGPSTGALYIFEDGVLGVNDTDHANSIVAFPNPTNGSVTISLGSTYVGVELSVVNMLGQTIFLKKYTDSNSLEFDIEGTSGMYFCDN